MSKQTEAQRLADELIALHGYPLSIKAADELRRLDAELERKSDAIQRLWAERDSLRASMAQLLEALEDMVSSFCWGDLNAGEHGALEAARSAISKTKEQA